MKQIGLIFWHEYWEHVTRKGYLLFTFGFPMFVIGMPLAVGVLISATLYFIAPVIKPPAPLGIVDQAALLLTEAEQTTIATEGYLIKKDVQDFLRSAEDHHPEVDRPPLDSPLTVIFFRTTQEAAAALGNEQIQGYYTLPADYWQTGQIELTYYEAPNQLVQNLFTSWVRLAVSQDVPPEILQRYYSGPVFTSTGLAAESRDFGLTNFIEGAIIYMIIYFVRLVGTSFTANYLFDSISQEADDRTLEILITSTSPLQFLVGKISGILAVGFTQLLMWASLALIGVVGLALVFSLDVVTLIFGWPYLSILISMLVGAYVMDHLLAAALGLLKVSGGAGMQLLGMINLVMLFGLLYATYFIPRNPHTWVAIAASLFPITSPIVLMIRLVVTDVPTWQIVWAQIVLWSTNLVALWWLRRLLKANLLGAKGPFRLRAWLKGKLPRLRWPIKQSS